jgi:uncharacterized membrane protein YjgN (DUF898 family)
MNDMNGALARERAEPESAFEFTGSWREFLPIALTNLLLTVVTLGFYRFWAKARERRYLWSRTRFIDDALEWTGTGKEMFLGFLIVMLVLLPTFLVLRFVVEALALRGEALAAALLVLAVYIGFFYLIGVAQFRALRYRLSRTWWHGIRGGSDDGGWGFGGKYVMKTVLGMLPLGLLVPWSMVSLWNDRWNRMSFGRHEFTARAETGGLIGRWLLIYLVPIVGVVLMSVGMMSIVASLGSGGDPTAAIGTIFVFAIFFYLAVILVSLSYFAAYYRQVAGATSVAGIDFAFTARTKDWLKLILGNIGLIIVTLGFGIMFVGYRNWSFAIRHMEATGEVNLDTLLQSQTRAPGDAEGLADAFDIGAI